MKTSLDDNMRFAILKIFHSAIIMGPGWYDYHGFMIIAQPNMYVILLIAFLSLNQNQA